MPSITVTITPSAVNSIGSGWCIEGVTDWLSSGEAYTVAAGSYVIQYRPVEGYTTPADASVTVVASNLTPSGVYASDAWLSGWQPPVSICLSRGQVFCAGVKHTSPESAVADARIVRWSEIGAFRFLGATATALRNEAGELYLGDSNVEAAMRVLPIETGIIVYGAYSTVALDPVSQPAPTFRINKRLYIGIANPLAVAGNDKKHLLVDRVGNLWMMTLNAANVVTEKSLGYSHILGPMQDGLSMATGKGIISVVYNPDDDEFYISNGEKSYLFNESGLTRIDKAITSYVNVSGSLMSAGLSALLTDEALGATTMLEASSYLYVETDIIDFNMAAIKTIQQVEVAGSIGEGAYAEVMIMWRNTANSVFMTTPWKRCSPGGVAHVGVSGRDFKVCYRVLPHTDAMINSMTVEWQVSDKTSVRGNYTNVSSLTAKSGQ